MQVVCWSLMLVLAARAHLTIGFFICNQHITLLLVWPSQNLLSFALSAALMVPAGQCLQSVVPAYFGTVQMDKLCNRLSYQQYHYLSHHSKKYHLRCPNSALYLLDNLYMQFVEFGVGIHQMGIQYNLLEHHGIGRFQQHWSDCCTFLQGSFCILDHLILDIFLFHKLYNRQISL